MKEKTTKTIKKVGKALIWVAVGIGFVVVVPILINEAYKRGPGYVTIWGAKEVLGYYGTILGACVTAVGLVATIRFTKSQLQRDNYLKSETEKWGKVESIVGSILNEINPMQTLKQEFDTGLVEPSEAMRILQKYQLNCRTATDQLMAYINNVDYVKISDLISRVAETADKLYWLSQKKIDQYGKQQQLKNREPVLKLLSIEERSPGSLSKKEIAEYQDIIGQTNDIHLEDIMDAITQISKEFVNIYETEYRALLQFKGATFEVIGAQIQENADKILPLRR